MTAPRLRWVSFLAPNMAPVYQFVAKFVGDRLGYTTSFSVGRSFAEFESGAADIGFICGLPYVQLTRTAPSPVELLAAPVLQGDRYDDRPIYFSDVIVSADSPIAGFEQLRGHSWSYNEPRSHSGHNLVCHKLAELGSGADFFSRVVGAGWHQRSIDMVAARDVDASAIDSQVLAIELRDRPELRDRIKVVDVLGPSTIQPVVAATRLERRLKDDVKRVLTEMSLEVGARAPLAHGYVDRWEAIEDAAYDDIRAMLVSVENAGVDLHRVSVR